MVPYNLNMSGQSLALVLIGKHANSKKQTALFKAACSLQMVGILGLEPRTSCV